MAARRAETDSLFRIEGFAKLSVTRSLVTMSWPTYPEAEWKSVTFPQGVVDAFVANTRGENFTTLGTILVPDFIYIEDNLD